MPSPKVVFHTDDLISIPFSLAWTGFCIFWESKAIDSNNTFMILWGIPFVVIGNYILWGRFLMDAWLKRRTYYAVTNRRILILQDGWRTKSIAMYLDSIPMIECEGANTGTLWFGPKLPVIAPRGKSTRDWSRFSLGETPVFADIDDIESVHKLILDLRNETQQNTSPSSSLSYR
jgi:hypothetical protein